MIVTPWSPWADDVLAAEQNQNARDDAKHSQTSGD